MTVRRVTTNEWVCDGCGSVFYRSDTDQPSGFHINVLRVRHENSAGTPLSPAEKKRATIFYCSRECLVKQLPYYAFSAMEDYVG